MTQIRLPRGKWEYDSLAPLGPEGSWGTVYEGHSPERGRLAIKRLKTRPVGEEDGIGAAVERDPGNVLTTYDVGQDAESGEWFVVMARADENLQSHLDAGGRFQEPESVRLLRRIVGGLLALPGVVHGNLKPRNILRLGDGWVVGDFGVAPSGAWPGAATAVRTCPNSHFAAPEIWRGEPAAAASDVYALGCLAHCLIAGKPPFDGSTVEELRHQHLSAAPPPLGGVSGTYQALVAMMLRKPAEARPSLTRLADQLDRLIQSEGQAQRGALAPGGGGRAPDLGVGPHRSASELDQARREKRDRLADQAFGILDSLFKDLCDRIVELTASAPFSGNHPRLHACLSMGGARLELRSRTRGAIPPHRLGRHRGRFAAPEPG